MIIHDPDYHGCMHTSIWVDTQIIIITTITTIIISHTHSLFQFYVSSFSINKLIYNYFLFVSRPPNQPPTHTQGLSLYLVLCVTSLSQRFLAQLKYSSCTVPVSDASTCHVTCLVSSTACDRACRPVAADVDHLVSDVVAHVIGHALFILRLDRRHRRDTVTNIKVLL